MTKQPAQTYVVPLYRVGTLLNDGPNIPDRWAFITDRQSGERPPNVLGMGLLAAEQQGKLDGGDYWVIPEMIRTLSTGGPN